MQLHKILLVLALTLFSSLQGNIEQFFKKIKNQDKSDIHSMRNIDFIYMINLDQRPEKFQSSNAKLNPYGIFPYRFSAVNGWEIPLEAFQKLGIVYDNTMKKGIMGTSYLDKDLTPSHSLISKPGQTYFSHCMSRGAIGIVLSHLSILQDAYDSGYETIWVMEDDIEIVRDPNVLSDLIKQLDRMVGKKHWDVLFTDQDTRNNLGEYVPCTDYAKRPNFQPLNTARFAKKTKVGNDFMKIGARYGAYSMIVRRSGIKKILDFIKEHKVFLPYDMEFYLPDNINLYCVSKDVISHQLKALSDNGGPNYLKKPQ
jgi:GR25 family glycosyltransferase involved in LPS biosynthesis